MRFRSVVLPAPRKPESKVTGTGCIVRDVGGRVAGGPRTRVNCDAPKKHDRSTRWIVALDDVNFAASVRFSFFFFSERAPRRPFAR
jgi:hypothetical protein